MKHFRQPNDLWTVSAGKHLLIVAGSEAEARERVTRLPAKLVGTLRRDGVALNLSFVQENAEQPMRDRP